MTAKRIVLAGGSGFLGAPVRQRLVEHGYHPVVLTRSPNRHDAGAEYVGWDGKTLGDWAGHLDGAFSVVNLVGRSINCRHTPENRREIIESRVDSVKVLAEAVRQCRRPPESFVQASAVGFYGDAGDRVCDESAPRGDDFVAEVCARWEQAIEEAVMPDTRQVVLRMGVAFGRGGGVLEVLARLTRWFLGGTVGRGRQYVSWIHVADLATMFLWAIEREPIAGTYNAVGPNPVTNAELMRHLRRVLRRPWCPPAPAPAVRVGAWLMGTSPELALTGQRCVPARFAGEGFQFRFHEVGDCLEDLLGEELMQNAK